MIIFQCKGWDNVVPSLSGEKNPDGRVRVRMCILHFFQASLRTVLHIWIRKVHEHSPLPQKTLCLAVFVR